MDWRGVAPYLTYVAISLVSSPAIVMFAADPGDMPLTVKSIKPNGNLIPLGGATPGSVIIDAVSMVPGGEVMVNNPPVVGLGR